MPKSSNQDKQKRLSAEFPVFTYEEFIYSLEPEGLKIKFHFTLGEPYHFYPTLFIPIPNRAFSDEILHSMLPSLVFHIGMVELISYWKLACPPKVIIKPATLNPEQVGWWKKLYYFGLGEFFYLNSIVTDENSFMNIEARGEVFYPLASPDMNASAIIPVGGGKDSVVTLDLLRKYFDTMPMVLNTRGATSAVIEAAGFDRDKSLLITRTIDPLLIKLNALGFLNGHTPFSALLAFISVAAALLTGRKYIVLSNEASANEPTIPGTGINHQYSKSLEFENDFRSYVNKYIIQSIEYFSFLRPLNELQIAWLFSRLPSYHRVFRSCNAGSNTDTWCGKCPKCLFTFIILSPFMGLENLATIFGKNMLEDATLAGILNQFTGAADEKPFDCIGTIDEVNMALCETIRNQDGSKLPLLLQNYLNSAEYGKYNDRNFIDSLQGYDTNNLPERFENVLKAALHA